MKTPEDKVKQEIFIEYIRAKLPEADLCYYTAKVEGQNVDIFLGRAWDFAEKASKLLSEEENQHDK